MKNLSDAGTERALIAGIIKHGKNAFIEASSWLESNDFSIPINRVLFTTIKTLDAEADSDCFDTEMVRIKATVLGFDSYMKDDKNIEYIELLNQSNLSFDNIQTLSKQVKKLSIARQLYQRHKEALGNLDQLTGTEDIDHIIAASEAVVVDYLYGVNSSTEAEVLGLKLEDRLNFILSNEPVDQVGIPSGYPLWDASIGGGPRKATLTFVVARPKVGKSYFGLNVGIHASTIVDIPTLILDSEMTTEYQMDRLMCIQSRCPISVYETGQFQDDRGLVQHTRDAAEYLKNKPLYHISVAGKTPIEIMSIARRWIAKHVGIKENGEANDCLIIYDYLKLTNPSQLKNNSPEWLIVGFFANDLHNFAVKYKIPIIVLTQTNRIGIDNEDTSIISQSDRLLWLCSSMTVLKNKDANDEAQGCGYQYGNKKLIILEARQGSGLDFNDYINLHASLRPRVGSGEACGYIREGSTYLTIAASNANSQ